MTINGRSDLRTFMTMWLFHKFHWNSKLELPERCTARPLMWSCNDAFAGSIA